MSEYNAILSSSKDCGYLTLKNTLSVFDRDLGMPSAKTSLSISFSNQATGESIVKEFSLSPEAVEVDARSMGHRVRLDASINNTLATLVNRVNGRFRASVKEYELADNKVRGEVRYFETLVDDSFGTVSENVEPQPSYVNPAQSKAADATFKADAYQSAPSGAAAAGSAAAAASYGAKAKSSLPLGKILGIAGGIVLLLLLALLAYKLFTSFLGSAAPSVPAQTQEALAPEPESAKEEEAEPVKEEQAEPQNEQPDESAAQKDTEAEAEVNGALLPDPLLNKSKPQELNGAAAVGGAVSAQNSGANVSCALSDAEDAAIISSCMSGSADSAALIRLSHEAFAAKRCNLGKRVLSAYGRKNSQVAYAYAQYFDPNSELSSECEQKSKSQAVYWYEKSLELSDNPESKQALSKLKE